MIKYLSIPVLLLIGAAILNSTINYDVSRQQSDYIALPSWTHSMLQYCRISSNPCSFLPFQYAWANRLWVQAIQYIGTDIYASYHPSLYARLHDITTLAQYWEYPYVVGQYLLPDTQEDNQLSIDQTIQIGRKGLESLCDTQAMKVVGSLTEEEYLTMYYSPNKIVPCERYLLPKSLGFVSFYYAQDIPNAIMYYRVAALAYDAPDSLVNMPALIVARYDDDRKSMMLWQQRFWAAQDQLNPLLEDQDLFFLLSVMEHAIRKAVHHGFLSLIQETAEQYACDQSIDCVGQHIGSVAQSYLSYCDDEDQVLATMCHLLIYARDQGRRDGRHRCIYPLDPQAMVYGWRPDLDKWDVVPR